MSLTPRPRRQLAQSIRRMLRVDPLARIEDVPHVGVAVGDRAVRVQVGRRHQPLQRVEQAGVEGAGRRRETVTECLRETRVALATLHADRGQGLVVQEGADPAAEPGMPPPEAVEGRPRVHDPLAHLDAGRQGPRRHEHVRVREVLEQEADAGVAHLRAVAPGQEPGRRERRRLAIEVDLLLARLRRTGSSPEPEPFRIMRVGACGGASGEYSTRRDETVEMSVGCRSPGWTAITRPVGSAPLARSRSVRSSLEMVAEGVATIVSGRSCHRPGSAGRGSYR